MNDMTTDEIMKMVANEHSYETWEELMFDSHPHWQVHCTKQAMERYAEQKLNKLHIMQAEGSDVSEGAAVGQRSVGQNVSDDLTDEEYRKKNSISHVSGVGIQKF